MRGDYHDTWYIHDLDDASSTPIDGEGGGELHAPFPVMEAKSRAEESDPRAWSFVYKIFVSGLLNAFPLIVAIGTSILSPAGKALAKEFGASEDRTVLTTSLFMLVCFCFPPCVASEACFWPR